MKLIGRELTVAIFVERAEGGGGVGDLVGGDDAIVIRIEHANERGRRRALAVGRFCAGRRRWRERLVVGRGLSGEGERSERQAREEEKRTDVFHNASSLTQAG